MGGGIRLAKPKQNDMAGDFTEQSSLAAKDLLGCNQQRHIKKPLSATISPLFTVINQTRVPYEWSGIKSRHSGGVAGTWEGSHVDTYIKQPSPSR